MDELRDERIIKGLLLEIEKKTDSTSDSVKIMEVCGTHTMTIHKFGLKNLLGKAGVEMLSGPGCPVCITPNEIHQAAIDLITRKENYILTTFGDMTRVPTQEGSLQTVVPASGSLVKIVYSPFESLEIARQNPDKDVIFFGVGFETTIPAILLTAKAAQKDKIDNYSILSAMWIIPPPLRALLESKDTEIQGFLYPGHVSAIIGEKPYRFVADEFGIPGCIAGFEPTDILLAILSILDQIREGKPRVANEYARVVRPSGNRKAQGLMEDIAETKDAFWRGLGNIPQSGLKLKDQFSPFDAEKKYGLNIVYGAGDLHGCRCGDILKGKISPPECGLFGKKCNPDSPYGPCMVSFEGACLAYYRYGRKGN
jgi:hydrogenase expression/formation protein HypD